MKWYKKEIGERLDTINLSSYISCFTEDDIEYMIQIIHSIVENHDHIKTKLDLSFLKASKMYFIICTQMELLDFEKQFMPEEFSITRYNQLRNLHMIMEYKHHVQR